MSATDIITLEEAKRILSMEQTDTAKDAELAGVIEAVSTAVDSFSGPVVRRTITDELYDGGSTLLFLREYPVYSVTAVTDYLDTTATVLTAATLGSAAGVNNYQFDPDNGLLWRRRSGYDYAFSTGRRNVKVTYVAGRYADTNSVVEPFKKATEVALRDLWGTWFGGGNVSYGSYVSADGESHRVTWVLPSAAEAMLPRRAPRVA